MTNPLRAPRVWDTALIAGVETPGHARIIGLRRPRKWDAEKGYGISGGGLKFTGEDVPEFELELRMWTAEQIDVYNDNIRPLVEAVPDKKNPRALSFSHPGARGIPSVVVVDPGELDQAEPGWWVVRVKLKKYTKPKAALGKPTAAKKKTGSAEDQLTAAMNADAELEQLQKQLKELAA